MKRVTRLLTYMDDNPRFYSFLHKVHGYFWLCLAFAVVIASLAGCSAIPGYSQYKAAASGLLDNAIIDRKDFNDKRLDVTLNLVCDNTIGAFARETDNQRKAAIAMLCGLTAQPALVLDNLTGAIAVNPAFLGPAPPVVP